MSETETCSILSVGTELTEGIVQDTHLRFLASELKQLGIRVVRGLQVPDELSTMRRELRRIVSEDRLVIITGGLGPTSDDLTREVVAEVSGRSLVFHHKIWEDLRSRYGPSKISDTNRKQALAPESFTVMQNSLGTAPGFTGAAADSFVVALPGPPRELREMFRTAAKHAITSRFQVTRVDESRVGTAFLISESSLEEALVRFRDETGAHSARRQIRWGTRIEDDRIVFRVWGGREQDRNDLFVGLGERFGPVKVRSPDVSAAQLLASALQSVGGLLVTAESCTGGLLGKLMTDLPGSSQVYTGGFVTYSNRAKELLGVNPDLIERHGAVSREVVDALGCQALTKSGADYSIAVSGIAGPAGGTAQKPVGTVWISVKGADGRGVARHMHFIGSRDAIRRRTAVASFLLAEILVQGKEHLDNHVRE